MSPEKSMFWDTGEAGTDGENPYDQEEYALLFQEMFTRAADQGPLRTSGSGFEVGGELQVVAGAGQVFVASGRAIVGGWPYRNPSTRAFPVDLPLSATRHDLVCVTATWATKKVRLTYYKNPTEGVDDLETTHNRGTLWDIPLARVQAGTDGNIVVVDERKFCQGGLGVHGDTVAWDSLTYLNHQKRIRWTLLPLQPSNPSAAMIYSAPPGWYAPGNIETAWWARAKVPTDFAQNLQFSIVGRGTTTGNYWMGIEVGISRNGFAWDEMAGSEAGIVSLTANLTYSNICPVALSPYQGADQTITVKVTRYGNAPGDDGDLFVFDGVRMQWLADS